MKKTLFIFPLFAFLFLLGCGKQSLDQQQVEATKAVIRSMIDSLGEAYSAGDLNYFKEAVSSDVAGFGTTKDEVYSNVDEFIASLQQDFKSLEGGEMRFPEGLRHLSIQISENGDMAAAIFEAPYEFTHEEYQESGLFRMSYTWKKKNGQWKIVHWFAATPEK